ncbi:hypothetical protein M758_5G132700 [Ceratodon purpureus]|uniref:peptidyl-tRNA hydrolase n=1 Tax=Ceratodon purpureus TaxID=3225 RepID=A0A8T0I197_CERPU|nr:hypothetical protein KC19_5G138700 [Ceratodon purpureus]KAG0616661.1 hypothetical protein M758_5G132700 [Ceratodon purpureus]
MASALSEAEPMDASTLPLTSAHLVAMAAGFLTVGYFLGRTTHRPAAAAAAHVTGAGEAANAGASAGAAPEKRRRRKEPLEVDRLAESYEDFKMVLVVRNDLKMGKGKIAAQCSHATLGLYKDICTRAPKALQRWEMCGQVKVVTKVETEEDMLALRVKAKESKLPCHITVDAGRTQIAPNSRTVMAVLGPAELVDDVTGHLKLM